MSGTQTNRCGGGRAGGPATGDSLSVLRFVVCLLFANDAQIYPADGPAPPGNYPLLDPPRMLLRALPFYPESPGRKGPSRDETGQFRFTAWR